MGAPKHNLRTGLILLSVALVFFGGIVVKIWLFGK
ncbi:MAG: cytochrome oxidase small assembly protein [Rhodocyclaceae bacterium]|nr:cytochrome oxidase small assembly protein [Rhodocyclaceae bacterium]